MIAAELKRMIYAGLALLYVWVLLTVLFFTDDRNVYATDPDLVAACDTDTDCAEKFGGNGDPEPMEARR